MAEETTAGLLSSVLGEIKGANKKKAREEVKTLVADHAKAMDIVRGIEAKIADKLTEAGEPSDVVALLRGE